MVFRSPPFFQVVERPCRRQDHDGERRGLVDIVAPFIENKRFQRIADHGNEIRRYQRPFQRSRFVTDISHGPHACKHQTTIMKRGLKGKKSYSNGTVSVLATRLSFEFTHGYPWTNTLVQGLIQGGGLGFKHPQNVLLIILPYTLYMFLNLLAKYHVSILNPPPKKKNIFLATALPSW